MEVKTFKLWVVGPSPHPRRVWSGMPIFMGRMEGESFNEAVANYINELPEDSQDLYSLVDGNWYFRGTRRIYEHYDEVVKVNRPSAPDESSKKISVWKEGSDTSGNICHAQHLFDTAGIDLNAVVKKFVDGILDDSKSFWRYDAERKMWTNWGCRIFDNEVDARKLYG